MASKSKFYHKTRLHYMVARGIMQFNEGEATEKYDPLGAVGLKIAAATDKKRKMRWEKLMLQKEEKRAKKRRTAAAESRKKRQEGTTYEAGGF